MERRPEPNEYGEFYRPYVAAAPDGSILDTLREQRYDFLRLAADVPADMEQYRYAPGKWSVRELVGHLTDSERMFAMRAMAFARGDRAHYPGFDENEYVAASGADDRTLAALVEEWDAARYATLLLFKGLPDAAWNRRGRASGFEFTVRSMAWITAGHMQHHMRMLRTRYLGQPERERASREPSANHAVFRYPEAGGAAEY